MTFTPPMSDSLGHFIVKLAAQVAASAKAEAQRQDAQRRTVAMRIAEASNWNDALARANEFIAIARAEISRSNSKKTGGAACKSWKDRAGVDPMEFHQWTLVFETQLGGHRKKQAARDLAVRHLRPGLSINEYERLAPKLKGLLEKPSAALRPLFANQEAMWRDVIGKFAQN